MIHRWQLAYLGRSRIPRGLSTFDIEYFFTLTKAERDAVQTRRGTLHRLGIALQLGFIKMTGGLLSAVHVLPPSILAHIGAQLGTTTPDIASIRTLYGRDRTLHAHHNFAADILGFRTLHGQAERGLVAHLRREAAHVFDPNALLKTAYRWLYEHRYLMPNRRYLQDRVRQSIRHAERALLAHIDGDVDADERRRWMKTLRSGHPHKRTGSRLDWLREGPRRSSHQLVDELEKVLWLRELGVAGIQLEEVSIERMRLYAQRVFERGSTKLDRKREPGRSIELVCFLRYSLLRTTDAVIDLLDQGVVRLWREARARADTQRLQSLTAYRELVDSLWTLANDDNLSAERLRDSLVHVLTPFRDRPRTRTVEIREQLVAEPTVLRSVLSAIIELPISTASEHPLSTAVPLLQQLYASKARELPVEVSSPFSAIWAPFLSNMDRRSALCAYEAAALLLLRRSLRNGSAWIDHSLSYRRQDALFIAPKQWESQRSQHYRRLHIPQKVDKFLTPLLETLNVSLYALAMAVEDGTLAIADGEFQIKRGETEDTPSSIRTLRQRLFQAVGEAQLPDVMLEVDEYTRFSWSLLNRPPHNERELITLYAAVLAHGTDLSARQVARMVPKTNHEAIGHMMRRLEDPDLLRKANDGVLAFMQRHPIVAHWGEGNLASSDMMSLEATRHLWNVRTDPRRRTYAIGMYTHVLDQWGIIYDQPIVLNRRQAGVAIEGVVRQEHRTVEKLAVDTHGYTDFAMAIAKLLGFDLCPRLARLSERKLYVPRGTEVPDVLKPVLKPTVSLRHLRSELDGLVRVAASIHDGWCSAVVALERYGSASRGDPIYQAGQALGQLVRTLYLCDYFLNPYFRSLNLKVLNYGESIHTLQRAIHVGPVGAKRGRRPEARDFRGLGWLFGPVLGHNLYVTTALPLNFR